MVFLRRKDYAQAVCVLWCFLALIGVTRAADLTPTPLQTDPHKYYRVEIYYSSNLPTVGYNTNSILEFYTRKLILENADIDDVQVKELSDALANQRPCKEDCLVEIKWSFVIREYHGGKILYQASTDPWVKHGIVQSQIVTFTDDLAKWVRKYLTAAFELESGAYRAPVLGDKK